MQFSTALHDAGVPSELHIFQKGSHGYGLGMGHGDVSAWTGICIEWMKTGGIIRNSGIMEG